MKEFWDIDTYIAGISEQSVFNMSKLFKKTITIKDVEKFLGTKLARAGKYDSVEVVCTPWVDKDGDLLEDLRKERGRRKYYKLKNIKRIPQFEGTKEKLNNLTIKTK